jgi:hypothetical protein
LFQNQSSYTPNGMETSFPCPASVLLGEQWFHAGEA